MNQLNFGVNMKKERSINNAEYTSSDAGACTQKKKSKPKVLKIVTSFYPVYAMVKEVSGDLNDVRMIQSVRESILLNHRLMI